uniref:Monoacylglycerol O-acyltransferase 3b n=1 Tax=Lepisosteus oculatus TaxID=7918 RepID=W5N803_LEPOC|nr:PREDICTED: 2-acylglycerol O-acyltransferase 3 [Lepisosteus oculatus]
MEQEKTTWKEFIENISVLQWVLTFLIMGISCTILMLYLIFTSLWLLSVLYFIWMVIDWDTPERGGRRSDWIRNWSVWKHIRDYYPVTLVKTAELSPSKNFVLGYHPHGIMCAGAFSCFSTEGAGFSAAFPGIQSHLATLAGLFRLPLYRDYLMSSGTARLLSA